MNTLQLSPSWDLTLDSNGNLAILSGPAAIAQDVASAISVFLGELYWDTTQGIPWLSDVLGQSYNPQLMVALLEKTALTVPGVVTAKAAINSYQNGMVSGSITVTDDTGTSQSVGF
jgi:hypothetical protein